MIESGDGLEFLPLLFDYLRRKYDLKHKADDDKKHADTVMPYTPCLSPTQLQDFQRVCDFWIPGMLYHDLIRDTITMMPHLAFLDMTQGNYMAELLAKKEFFGFSFYNRNMKPLIDSMKRNDLNG